jgi:hypothetical protein
MERAWRSRRSMSCCAATGHRRPVRCSLWRDPSRGREGRGFEIGALSKNDAPAARPSLVEAGVEPGVEHGVEPGPSDHAPASGQQHAVRGEELRLHAAPESLRVDAVPARELRSPPAHAPDLSEAAARVPHALERPPLQETRRGAHRGRGEQEAARALVDRLRAALDRILDGGRPDIRGRGPRDRD